MALPLDIQRALQIIDQRIAVLQQTKAMILHEFSDEKSEWQSPFRFIESEEERKPQLEGEA